MRQIFIEFKSYSVPLFWASSIGVFASIADRWLLQAFGGSAQQGYYSLGFNLAAICFLLTSSFTPLLQREYAIAFENREMDKLKNPKKLQ